MKQPQRLPEVSSRRMRGIRLWPKLRTSLIGGTGPPGGGAAVPAGTTCSGTGRTMRNLQTQAGPTDSRDQAPRKRMIYTGTTSAAERAIPAARTANASTQERTAPCASIETPLVARVGVEFVDLFVGQLDASGVRFAHELCDPGG